MSQKNNPYLAPEVLGPVAQRMADMVDEEVLRKFTEPDKPEQKNHPVTFEEAQHYQVEKFKVLYQARYIVRKFGTVAERQVVGRQLKKMNKEIDKLNA